MTTSTEKSVVTFCDWTGNRDLPSFSTNTGAQRLPFQDWRHFKESFAPELIARAVRESPIPVERCVDPFGGSGTTSLACQFLGVHPITVEVNPYLADLIEAKLTAYPSTTRLMDDLHAVLQADITSAPGTARSRFAAAPTTFVEPGHNERWIFNEQIADCLGALLDAIDELEEPSRRLFRVILSGILVDVSNVTVNGKGRRYRQGWRDRTVLPRRVVELFQEQAADAIDDIQRFANRALTSYDVCRGDSREVLRDVGQCQLAVFSPPYANSFDYTDVYNIELWALGYLESQQASLNLRRTTLSSHVQVSWGEVEPPVGSPTLDEALERLHSHRNELWNPGIPTMVGAYFNDLLEVLGHLKRILVDGALAWMVVGDSRYAGVHIPVAKVLQELIVTRGWDVLTTEPCRSMRVSAQQGGDWMLAEHLLVLRNNPEEVMNMDGLGDRLENSRTRTNA